MKHVPAYILSLFALFAAFLQPLLAETFVPPTINTTTWTTAGNPYTISADSTVPSGQVLTIQPGVMVLLAPGVTLNIHGKIIAIGTETERISFQGFGPSNYWNKILSQDNGNGLSQFHWCDFSDAANLLHLKIAGRTATMLTEVFDCSFQNCTGDALLAEAIGITYFDGFNLSFTYPVASPTIKNCVFESISLAALHFRISGDTNDPRNYGARGSTGPVLVNNIIRGINGVAFRFEEGNVYSAPSQATVANNTVIGAAKGIVVQDPYDITVENNIVANCVTAGIERLDASSLNLSLRYNCLFNNPANFVNYPVSYGAIVRTNNNGDQADSSLNIFLDPKLNAAILTLASDSPCVDAGDPTTPFNDVLFPPSQGTGINDIGVTGGPNAFSVNPERPIVTALDPTAVTKTSATLNASVNPNGTATTGYFEYSTSPSFPADSTTVRVPPLPANDFDLGAGTSTGPMPGPISGLQPATKYYFRATATNTAGSTSASSEFTTFGDPPIVSNLSANPITLTGATLHATVNPQSQQTTARFEVSTDPAFLTGVVQAPPGGQVFNAGTTGVAFDQPVINLTPLTKYFFRVVAGNASPPDTTSATGSFTTGIVATDAVTAVGQTMATFNGRVNPQGLDGREAYFEYSTDSAFPTSGAAKTKETSPRQGVGNGNTSLALQPVLVGSLKPRTKYYVRAVLSNPTTKDTQVAPVEFTTLRLPAIVTTKAATMLTSATMLTPATAVLNATVNPQGSPTMLRFKYGTTAGLLTETTAPINVGDGTVAVARGIPVSGLDSLTTYFFEAEASNDDNADTPGGELSFTTPPRVDTVTTTTDLDNVATTFLELGIPAVDAGYVGGQATLKSRPKNPVIYGGPDGKAIPGLGVGVDFGSTEMFSVLGDPTFAGGANALAFAGQTQPKPAPGLAERWLFSPRLLLPQSSRATTPAKALAGLFSKLSAGGPVRRVAALKQAAPGGGTFAKFNSFGLPKGRVGTIYLATLTVSGTVTKANNLAVWREKTDGSGSDRLLGTGDVVEGRTIKKLAFMSPVANTPDQRRSFAPDGGIAVAATFEDGSTGIVRVAANGAVDLAVRYEKTTEVFDEAGIKEDGYVFSPLTISPATASAKRYALLATALKRAAAGLRPLTSQGIYASFDGNAPRRVLSRGYQPPELPGERFASLGHPAMGESGLIGLIAGLSGKQATAGKKKAVVTVAEDGSKRVLARLGDQAPGTPDKVVFATFKSMVVTDAAPARTVFTATLKGAGVKPANNLGLWGTTAAGEVKVLLRTGQSIKVDDQVVTVRSFTGLQPVSASQGQGRSTDTIGTVVVKATLSNGQKGALRLPVP